MRSSNPQIIDSVSTVSRITQHRTNCTGKEFPLFTLSVELFPSGSGDFVELCLAIVFRRSPGSHDQLSFFEPVKSWIKSTRRHTQDFTRNELQTLHDVPTMEWS